MSLHAVILLLLLAGIIQTGQSGISTNPPSYLVVDTIKLLYDPQLPDDVRIHSFGSLWLGALCSAVIAIGLTTVVLVLWLRATVV